MQQLPPPSNCSRKYFAALDEAVHEVHCANRLLARRLQYERLYPHTASLRDFNQFRQFLNDDLLPAL